MKELLELKKKYPNDQDFGREVRRFLSDENKKSDKYTMFNLFKKISEVVENIIYNIKFDDIYIEITNSSKNIDSEYQREFYRYMSSLFLNVLLNRLDSTPSGTEQKAIESRRVILDILNK